MNWYWLACSRCPWTSLSSLNQEGLPLRNVPSITSSGHWEAKWRRDVPELASRLSAAGPLLAPLTLPVSFSADSHFKTPSWCCGRTVGCHRRWSVPPGEPSELTPGWMWSVWEAFQNLSFGLFNWTWVFYLPCFVIPIATSGTAWDTSAAILSAGWHSSLWWVNGSMCGCVSVCSLCACFSLMGQDLLKCNLWLRMIKSLQNVCF